MVSSLDKARPSHRSTSSRSSRARSPALWTEWSGIVQLPHQNNGFGPCPSTLAFLSNYCGFPTGISTVPISDCTRMVPGSLREKRHAVRADLLDDVDLRVGSLEDEPHLVADLLVLQFEPLEHAGRHLADLLDRELAALFHENVALRVGDVLEDRAPRKQRLDLLFRLRSDDADLVVGVLREAADLLVEDLLGPDVLLLLFVLAREDRS